MEVISHGKILKINLDVTTVSNNHQQFASNEQFLDLDNDDDSCLVICYHLPETWLPEKGYHSLYAESYNPANRKFSCINSWGSNKSRPKVPDDNSKGKVDLANRVTFIIVEEKDAK